MSGILLVDPAGNLGWDPASLAAYLGDLPLAVGNLAQAMVKSILGLEAVRPVLTNPGGPMAYVTGHPGYATMDSLSLTMPAEAARPDTSLPPSEGDVAVAAPDGTVASLGVSDAFLAASAPLLARLLARLNAAVTRGLALWDSITASPGAMQGSVLRGDLVWIGQSEGSVYVSIAKRRANAPEPVGGGDPIRQPPALAAPPLVAAPPLAVLAAGAANKSLAQSSLLGQAQLQALGTYLDQIPAWVATADGLQKLLATHVLCQGMRARLETWVPPNPGCPPGIAGIACQVQAATANAAMGWVVKII